MDTNLSRAEIGVSYRGDIHETVLCACMRMGFATVVHVQTAWGFLALTYNTQASVDACVRTTSKHKLHGVS